MSSYSIVKTIAEESYKHFLDTTLHNICKQTLIDTGVGCDPKEVQALVDEVVEAIEGYVKTGVFQ